MEIGIDSFAAAVTAYKGSTEILLACIKWSTFFEPMKNYFEPLIAGSIFVSQTYFSFKLYKEDEKSGGNLWAKVYREKVQDWLPDWLKERLPKTEIIFPADGSNASPNLFKRLTNPTAPEEHQRSRSPTPDYFI